MPDKAKRLAPAEWPTGTDAVAFAAWTAVGRVLLNLDESITREQGHSDRTEFESQREARMNLDKMLSQFSKNRLDSESVPDDLKILLKFHDELAERTGIELNWEEDWAPWLDTSYLSEAERANPDIAANVRAIEEVCELIAFVAAEEDDQHFGYWRGPSKRKVADSPLVFLDNEGQFDLCAGKTLAEAILARVYDDERFTQLRDWFRAIGISIRCDRANELSRPHDQYPPDKLHNELYYRFRGQE